MKIWLLILICALFPAASAFGAFVKIETRNDPPFIWPTRGNGQWHASGTTGWWTYDDAYTTPYVMTTADGADMIRGVEYDSLNNRMVLFRGDTGEVRFHAMDGSYISSINTSFSTGNGISVDQRDGSLWLAYFGGQVRHYSSAGSLLSQFSAGFNLSGIALDPVSESLLMLRADGPGGANGAFDDELWEFRTDGANLGRRWTSSEIKGNGVGLEYLPNQGKLYVAAQFNASVPSEPYFAVSFYQDLGRVPEPASWIGVLIGTWAISCLRMRRRAESDEMFLPTFAA